MPLRVIQPQNNSGLAELLQLGQLGVGAATGNPYLLASGLLGGNIGSSVQELVNTYDEWQKRKAMQDMMMNGGRTNTDYIINNAFRRTF